MKQKKIGIIICYFGVLPDYFPLWRLSCEHNKGFDFIIITDQKIKNGENIIVYNIPFEELKSLIDKKLGIQTKIYTPYKLCDFKCMYGVIFEEILKNYDFWGMCDMDMVFGDLSKFITDEILESYDKIYQLGHLTLYKNNKEVNTRYQLEGWMDWKDVIQSPFHCRLCERGMMEKYRNANIAVYDKRDYADINKVHKQFQLSKWLVPKSLKNNYKLQVFFWENGKVFRQYYKKGKMHYQEFTYIHFQKRKMKKFDFNVENVESFYITRNAFVERNNYRLNKKELYLLNPYYGKAFELFECINFEIIKKYRAHKYNQKLRKILKEEI